MSDVAPASRRAFAAFLELLARVDAEVLGEERRVTDASDVAEGEHMLLHLVKAAIDVWVDNDATRPRFAPLASPVLKWGGEGADNPAHCAPLDPSRRYRIRGRMRDEVYISFTVYTGKSEGDWNDGVISALNHTEFEIADDGTFEIPGLEPNDYRVVAAPLDLPFPPGTLGATGYDQFDLTFRQGSVSVFSIFGVEVLDVGDILVGDDSALEPAGPFTVQVMEPSAMKICEPGWTVVGSSL